jgi:3-hydroxyisobutyrate dehydrogenase-like beta-hydroxyacid dehydrogenase
MKVGFIGLGRMGQGMAGRILAAGHDLLICDQIPENMQALQAAGAVIAGSIAEVCQQREVVISMLPHDGALEAVVSGPGGLVESMPAGMIHMAMGTHSIDQTNASASAHANANTAQLFIAAPVLGRPDMAASGQLSIVPAGPAEAIDRMQVLYDAMSRQTLKAGDQPQSAAAVKIANNYMLGSAIESMGEAFSLVRKLGVEPEMFLDVMVKGLFGSLAYKIYGPMLVEGQWESHGATAVIGLKDADLVIDAAKSAGISMPGVHIWREHLAKAIEHGEGSLDWAVMARQQFRNSGLE